MKCQYCEKPATFHITELLGEEPQELHLCEDHARVYLNPTTAKEQGAASKESGASAQVKVGQTAEELARLDQQACPVCGITFYEFRNVGRLGCPHDYVCFEDELEPLIVNIHGDTQHVGKRPKHGVHGTDQQTRLIQLRREMREAVEQEDYERASERRDEIRRIELQRGESKAD
jgi:protein arginine kinase activator